MPWMFTCTAFGLSLAESVIQHTLVHKHTLDVMHASGKTGICLHVLPALCIRAKCWQIETSADNHSSVVMLCQMDVFL